MVYREMQYYPSHDAYRRAWNTADKCTPAIPLNIDLELSARCNLKCPFCALTGNGNKNKTAPFMPVIAVYDILEEASQLGVPAVKFNWLGEPTLHPSFNLIMNWANGFGFYDRLINTNGNYKQEKNRGLALTTKAMFSIDSFNSDTYAKMRIGGDLKRVIDNIKDLLKRGHKNVWARKTITQDNQDENFEKAAQNYFGDQVKVSEHYVFDRGSKEMPAEAQCWNRKYCGYPSQRLVIDSNLNVYPCCADTKKEMKVGKATKDPLINIWQSPRMGEIRKDLRNNEMTSWTCKNCRSWMAYESPKREKVNDE